MSNSSPTGKIILFFTGGTISMKPLTGRRGVGPSREVERFLSELGPHLPNVELEAVHWSNLPSPHMTPQRMFQLAVDIDAALADPAVLGAVVLHGTDVLVESAFMADLIVRSAKPVIYTGSMRFYSESGYDGIRNLLNAVKACLLPVPGDSGVVLLMTDRLFAAREVIKINALNIDAFEAPESGPLGYVAGDTVLLTRCSTGCAGRRRQQQVMRPAAIEPHVALIQCYTGMSAALMDHLQQQKTAGLVIEGFGAGNVPPQIVAPLERMLADDVPVVLTTQCPQGGVWPIYGYAGGGADLEKRGVILGGRLSGAKARILLMVALGETHRLEAIRVVFKSYTRPYSFPV